MADIKTESVILVYAFRYALGRYSGSVLDVINNIMGNINKIDEKYKAIIVSETINYLKSIKDLKFDVPQDIVLNWKNLVIELLKVLKKESIDWLVNPLGGGIKEEILLEYRI